MRVAVVILLLLLAPPPFRALAASSGGPPAAAASGLAAPVSGPCTALAGPPPSHPSLRPTAVAAPDPILAELFDAANLVPVACPDSAGDPPAGYRRACGTTDLSPSTTRGLIDLTAQHRDRMDVATWQTCAEGQLRGWICRDTLYMVVVYDAGPPTLVEVAWGALARP